MGHKDKKRGSVFDNEDDSNVIGMLKKMQQQISFLERKIDRLAEAVEGGAEKERRPRFSKERKGPSYGSKERGYARDDDRQAGGRHGDREPSSGKKFYEKPFAKSSGKRSYGKPFAKPAGKSFGKPSGRSSGRPVVKKKAFSSRKKG